MKNTLLFILLIMNTSYSFGQTTISDSLRREIIHTVTDENLKFMAYKNPKYTDSDLYFMTEKGTKIGNRYSREILGISDKVPYNPWAGTYYDFMLDVKELGDNNLYLVSKKNNCFAGEIYTDTKRKELYKRDTVCLNLDTALFINNNRFVIYYNPKRQFGTYAFLAGNAEIYDDNIYK
ncbi:MAG: hypothetical protein WBP45_04815, partial [Daejeonella sp.]